MGLAPRRATDQPMAAICLGSGPSQWSCSSSAVQLRSAQECAESSAQRRECLGDRVIFGVKLISSCIDVLRIMRHVNRQCDRRQVCGGGVTVRIDHGDGR
jgi:hypothetical protein